VGVIFEDFAGLVHEAADAGISDLQQVGQHGHGADLPLVDEGEQQARGVVEQWPAAQLPCRSPGSAAALFGVALLGAGGLSRGEDGGQLLQVGAGHAGQPGVADVAPSATGEPLAAHWQWDMRMIDATPSGSYRVNQGRRGVMVGIMDTGVDGSHPDIRPNFNRRLSRNFTTDIPLVDGPCEDEPDQSCNDPADVDEDGHGTHVAGLVAAALNGLGTAGVAPRVTLVNIRAGQDSGFFFLQATVDAMVYAGLVGIDVINMSFYIDPWLYNCLDNPADSPEAQAEQRTIRVVTQRAINFARAHGVTPVGALGNQNTDLGNPTTDDISPDFPPGAAYHRDVDNSCITVPAETRGVISISALGPSHKKAHYSNWGIEQTDFSAPGGFSRDYFGTDQYLALENRILSTFPLNVLRASGEDRCCANDSPSDRPRATSWNSLAVNGIR
jgi:subtilisin family serine protease